jgi:hypothetical protein
VFRAKTLRVALDTQIHPYRQCEVCGHSPTVYTVRIWDDSVSRSDETDAREQHSFCVTHHAQAERLRERLESEHA